MPATKFKYTRIFLWRHPEVQGVSDGRFWGHTDVGLTRLGKQQLKTVAKRMSREKLTAIYSSDLLRARLVAEAVGRGQSPRRKVETLPALRELNLGIWEGLTYREIAERYPLELQARQNDLPGFRILQGESLNDVAERVMPAFLEIVAANQGGKVCVVAHAGVNRIILARLLGAPLDRIFRLEQQYACLNLIDVYEDGTPVIKRINQIVVDEE
ncbi:MAG: histidine phosphatase family protein [Desulfarculus sp.]|nr:histidine phosphatase family protein [Desulfarculus sp.]